MPTPLITYLRLFHNIPANDEQLFDAAWEMRHYKEGEYLFKADKVCRELFFICNGVLRITHINDIGDEATYFFPKENQFCSILKSFTTGVIASENIIAACDTDVLAISKDKLEQLYAQMPYLEDLFMKIMQQGLLDKLALRNSFHGLDSSMRYERFLMRQPDIALRVSMSSIASYLGMTPQSLSRIRKNMK